MVKFFRTFAVKRVDDKIKNLFCPTSMEIFDDNSDKHVEDKEADEK